MNTPSPAKTDVLKPLDRFSSFIESPSAFPYWLGLAVLITLAIFAKSYFGTSTYFPATIPVHIVSDPPGASILIQGIEVGKVTPADVELTMEQIDLIEVKLDGYVQGTYRKYATDEVIQLEYLMHLPGAPESDFAHPPESTVPAEDPGAPPDTLKPLSK